MRTALGSPKAIPPLALLFFFLQLSMAVHLLKCMFFSEIICSWYFFAKTEGRLEPNKATWWIRPCGSMTNPTPTDKWGPHKKNSFLSPFLSCYFFPSSPFLRFSFFFSSVPPTAATTAIPSGRALELSLGRHEQRRGSCADGGAAACGQRRQCGDGTGWTEP